MELLEHMRSRLADLHGMAQQTAAVEKRLLEHSQHRLNDVMADMDELRPRVAIDPAAADAYQRLVVEFGRLQQVIANARDRAA